MQKCLFAGLLLLPLLGSGCASKPQRVSGERDEIGRLYWGLNPATKLPWTAPELRALRASPAEHPVGRQLRNVLKNAEKELTTDKPIHVIEKIQHEGIMPGEPPYRASHEALEDTKRVLYLAVCARLHDEKPAAQCKALLRKALIGDATSRGWIHSYASAGNPINDSNLFEIFLAIDVAGPVLMPVEHTAVQKWLRGFVAAGNQVAGMKKNTSSSLVNNHETWRLAIRMTAARLIADKALLEETQRLVAKHAVSNLKPVDGWKIGGLPGQKPIDDPKCVAGGDEARYGSYDFRQRDALHYHVYDLQAWTWILIASEGKLPSSAQELVEEAFDFLRPYYLGERYHREFSCTSVQFDIERRNARIPEFVSKLWEPVGARKLLRAARPLLPAIKAWTKNVVDENFSPTLKLQTALMGI